MTKNKEHRERVREEIKEHCVGEIFDDFTLFLPKVQTTSKLSFLHMVIKEGLRLRHPITITDHYSLKEDISVAGYTLKRENKVRFYI